MASAMSNRRSVWVPVAAKYGEQPMRRLTVTRSAQNTECVVVDHLLGSPLQDLTKACLTLKWAHSTRLLVCKL